jgi:hypothetical protein
LAVGKSCGNDFGSGKAVVKKAAIFLMAEIEPEFASVTLDYTAMLTSTYTTPVLIGGQGHFEGLDLVRPVVDANRANLLCV